MRRRDFMRTLALCLLGAGIAPEVLARGAEGMSLNRHMVLDDNLKDYLHKMRNFDSPHRGDIEMASADYNVLTSLVLRLKRLEKYVGHGHFQLLGFDEGLKIAARASSVGAFPRRELEFMEMIFYTRADRFGFLGRKPLENLTDCIRKSSVVKVPYTGNYLFDGEPLETYRAIKKLLGDQVILTSGVRGVMKQFLLFLNKAYKNRGNLSLASRSLAPPGYSYHGIGDFDVGQVGLGVANFTSRFTTTRVYKSLSERGYLKLRYPHDNLLGVRFEPWHVKMSADV